MTEKFYTILTNVGKASVTNATTLGGKVDFKYMALGDGNGSYYNPDETQTTLKKEVYRGQINHIQVDEENPNWIKLSIVIPANIGGFTVREVGAFDTEGNLLLIGKYPETYKPVLADGSSKDLTINMILEVSNASVVNLKIDPSVIMATKQDFSNLAGIGRTTETVKKNADDIKTLSTQMAEKASQTDVDKINIKLENYNSYASVVDANGIYTVVDYKRADGTLYMKSTLSGGTSPSYTTDIWQFYDELGTTVVTTKTWTITYDINGKVTSKVVA